MKHVSNSCFIMNKDLFIVFIKGIIPTIHCDRCCLCPSLRIILGCFQQELHTQQILIPVVVDYTIIIQLTPA